MMPISPAIALALPRLREFEGFSPHPYRDSAGIWTIGYGFTAWDGHPVTANTPPVTQPDANACLATLAATNEARARAMCHVPLADHECAALICLAYNIGTGRLASSTLMARLNAGDRAGAADQFEAWVYAGGHMVDGLVTRRRAEKALFLGTSAQPLPAPAGATGA